MSETADRLETASRVTLLLLVLFAWTIVTVGVIAPLVPGDTRADQLTRMIAQQIMAVAGAAAAWSWFRRDRVVPSPSLPRYAWTSLPIALGLALVMVPVTELWSDLIAQKPPAWWNEAVDTSSPVALVWTVLALGVVPPICEELFFRGALLDEGRGLGGVGAVLCQALGFAAYHLDVYGLPSYLALGVVFGWMRLRLGLLACVLAHMTNNLLAVAWLDGQLVWLREHSLLAAAVSAPVAIGLITLVEHRGRVARV